MEEMEPVKEGEASRLPEGQSEPANGPPTKSDQPPRPKTLADRFRNIIGKARGLPADMALNHDHYLHGAPKR